MTHLLCNEIGELGIAMAQRIDGNTSCEVQILAVVNVPYVRALSFYEYWRRAGVCGNHEGSMFVDKSGARRVCVGVGVWDAGLFLTKC